MIETLPVFKALADASRLRLLKVLELGSFNVGELCSILEMGQSRVSRHLKILLQAGLLRSRREGSWVFYALPRPDASLGSGVLELLAAEAPAPEDRARALETLELRSRRSRQFFDEVAPRWGEVRERFLPDREYQGRLAEAVAGCPVLADLGAGTGELALELAGRHERLIGVDRSERMVTEARRRSGEAGLENVEFRLGTLEHLPLRDGEAGGAVVNMVLHYVADPAAALREVHRALAPGGRVGLADLAAHDQEWVREELNHQWLGFEPDDLSGWLEGAGFRDVTIETYPTRGEGPAVLLACGQRP